jgi:hypothetical protein
MSSEQIGAGVRLTVNRKLAAGAAAASAVAPLAAVFADATGAYLWVAIGSALGGMARHWCASVTAARTERRWSRR